MNRRGALLTVIVLTSLSPSLWAQEQGADDFELLQQVRIQFREGNYEAVERLATQIFESDPSMLVRAEAHQYLGASFELLGQSDEAEEQFEELLTLQPQFLIDRAEFPTEVVTLFETVRLRVQDRLRQIQEQRRRAQEQERLEQERQMREERERLLRLRRPRYMVRDAQERHWIVAFMPFGAGQFQNGHRRRGYVFLGLELALAVASATIWIMSMVVDEVLEPSAQEERWINGLVLAGQITAGSLGAAYLTGMIESAIQFSRLSDEPERWREIDEEEVPEEFRVDPDEELDEPLPAPGDPSTGAQKSR